VLPDFLGAALMVYALTKAQFTSPDIESARRGFVRLAYFSLLKIPSLVAIGALNGVDPAISLAFSFVFVLGDGVLLCMAVKDLFTGAGYIEARCGGSSALAGKRQNALSMSIIFFISRAVITMLPELGHLQTEDQLLMSAEKPFIFTQYRSYFNTANIVISLILGALWLGLCISYFIEGQKDGKLKASYEELYDSVDPGEDWWFKSRMKLAYSLLTAAAVFGIDFFVDGVNYIPDGAGALLVLWAVYLLIKGGSIRDRRVFWISALYLVLSVVSWTVSVIFAGDYYLGGAAAIALLDKAAAAYYVMVGLYALSSLLYGAVMLSVLRASYKNVNGYLRNRYKDELYNTFDKKRTIRRKLYGRISLSAVLVILTAAVKTAYPILMYSLPEFWMADTGLGILTAAVLGLLYSDIKAEIDMA